ncbi:TonB-dependent receptor [Archangium gephyra]|nr:TonB-dependent receptor [Archangium gephyra]
MRLLARVVLGLLLLAAPVSSAAEPPAEGMILGQVTDAETSRRLAKIVVTVTGQRSTHGTVTDERGIYRFPALPPGTYVLHFNVSENHHVVSGGPDDYGIDRREDIRLHPGGTVRVDAELWPIRNYILPYYGSPLLNDGSTSTYRLVDPGFIDRVPVNPPTGKGGMSRSFEGLATLAPGTWVESYGVSIRGASAFENRYVLDGFSVQDPFLGINALPLSREFIEELEIHTGGAMAEDGHTSGGTLLARTRKNIQWRLGGSLFGTWMPGPLQATSTPTSGPTWSLRGQNRVSSQTDVGGTLGGPLVKDKLWFFAGVAPALSVVEHTSTREEPGQPMDRPRTILAQARTLQALGTLTYRVKEGHDITLSVITAPGRSGGEVSLPVDPLTGRVRDFLDDPPSSLSRSVLDSHTSLGSLQYSGELVRHRLKLDARLGWLHHRDSRRPGESSLLPSLTNTADRYQAHVRATGTWRFLGEHVLAAGLSAEQLAHTRLETSGEPVLEGGPASREWKQAGTLLSGFVQDRWILGEDCWMGWMTLNAGLRYDLQRLDAVDQRLTFTPGARVSPSLGLSVHPASGFLRTKLFAYYAQHVTQVPLAVLDVPLSGTVDPELVLPSSSELLVGAEHLLLDKLLVSATYTRSGLDSALMPLGDEEGDSFVLANPGRGIARDRPKAERTLDAVTVSLYHAPHVDGADGGLSDHWWAQASYTWARLNGNYDGPLQPVPGWGEPALQPTVGIHSETGAQVGPLSSDRTHTVQVMGARRFFFSSRFSASLGGAYRGRSGTPIQSLIEPSPLTGRSDFALPRSETGERTPWVHDIDLRAVVDYQVRGSDEVASLSLEVFNLFNFQAVTRVNELSTTLDGTPIPEFKKPIQHQTPRQVRLGLRYAF